MPITTPLEIFYNQQATELDLWMQEQLSSTFTPEDLDVLDKEIEIRIVNSGLPVHYIDQLIDRHNELIRLWWKRFEAQRAAGEIEAVEIEPGVFRWRRSRSGIARFLLAAGLTGMVTGGIWTLVELWRR